jgi:predicted ribosome-associated RNA-binding protein Tma20
MTYTILVPPVGLAFRNPGFQYGFSRATFASADRPTYGLHLAWNYVSGNNRTAALYRRQWELSLNSSLKNNFYATCAVAAAFVLFTGAARAAQLTSDAKSSIPHDVQQLIVVDYRAMQNSPAAMSLKDRVLPPELKRLETALKTSGLKVDSDADTLAFAAFRAPSGVALPSSGSAPAKAAPDNTRIVGIAQGQFHTNEILANFTKNKTKPIVLRNNNIYPMGTGGMSVVFLNQSTMVFGDKDAVLNALDARDGLAPNFLTDSDLFNEMVSVDNHAIWSLLNASGTQMMMKGVLGQASQLTDYDTVRNRMKGSHYTMDFSNGVKFDMAVNMSDSLTAATVATLMKGVEILKKTQGTPLEKSALDATSIDSNSGTLTVSYSSSDSQFASLLGSPLFQSVVR